MKIFQKTTIAAALVTAFLLPACSDDETTPKDETAPEITLTSSATSTTVWNTIKLAANATDDQGILKDRITTDMIDETANYYLTIGAKQYPQIDGYNSLLSFIRASQNSYGDLNDDYSEWKDFYKYIAATGGRLANHPKYIPNATGRRSKPYTLHP